MAAKNGDVHPQDELAALRSKHYNASVETLTRYGDFLITLNVRPDQPFAPFEAGQYATLGLGTWEPTVFGAAPAAAAEGQHRLIRRPYSITTPLVDEAGQLVRAGDRPGLEFLIALARQTNGSAPPGLTPRLFALSEGARLYLAPKAHGRYTLQGVPDDANVIFAATGAGEAPHNAMLAELLHRGHRGRIVSLVCVRRRYELVYADAHRRLEQKFANYRYLGFTTREPENLDPAHPQYVGKRYLQDYITEDRLQRELGLPLDPAHTHIFLCGNPAMIGGSQKRGPQPAPGDRPGMVELLEERGFCVDRPGQPGNIHIEYW